MISDTEPDGCRIELRDIDIQATLLDEIPRQLVSRCAASAY